MIEPFPPAKYSTDSDCERIVVMLVGGPWSGGGPTVAEHRDDTLQLLTPGLTFRRASRVYRVAGTPRTWILLREAGHMLMQGVAAGLDLDQVRDMMLAHPKC